MTILASLRHRLLDPDPEQRTLTTRPGEDRTSLAVDGEQFAVVSRIGGIGLFVRDMRTDTAWWSPQMAELYGLAEGIHPPTLDDALARVHEEDAGRLRSALQGAAETESRGSVGFRFWRGDDLRNGEIHVEPWRRGGDAIGYQGTLQDVTMPTREANAMARELGRRAHLLDAVEAAVIATGTDGKVTHWNLGAERLYGWSCDETIGRRISTLTGSADIADSKEIFASVARDGRWEGRSNVPCKDGSSLSAYVQLTALRDDDGNLEGVVGVSMDITPQMKVERDLRNARDYLQAITANMAEGLLTLDTRGRLTYMNDAGDQLLGWREQGLVGERMADLVTNLSSNSADHEVNKRLLADLRPGDDPVKAEASLFIGRDRNEIEVAFTAAPFETELGEQGTVIVFRDVTEQRATERGARRKLERLSWIGKIRDALDTNRIVPFAQPVIALASGSRVQHELLVRLLDEEGEAVEPGHFLPTAEEFGLIVEIDKLMVRRAAEFAAQGHRVSVNLSAQSIVERGMVELIASEIRRSGADPALLTVELTETALLKSEHAALRFVERLAELGCDFALDDFGTGYGGFMYLKQLPIDYLKIDMEFVHDLTVNDASQRVVRAVVDLARGFGQLTIAEGIETQETWDMLNLIGVDFGQGFLFGVPVPAGSAFGINDHIDQEQAR